MQEVNDSDLSYSLSDLCTELHTAYGHERAGSVIVLIDEYDRILTSLSDNEKDQGRMVEFLTNFFELGLKTCDAVSHCVIMGSVPVAHQALILPNNMRTAYNMFNNPYAK